MSKLSTKVLGLRFWHEAPPENVRVVGQLELDTFSDLNPSPLKVRLGPEHP